MRILQLIDSLSVGGAERMAVNIASKLTDDGIENSLVVARQVGETQLSLPADLNLCFLEKKNFLDLKAFRKLVQWTSKHEVDVIHAHSSSIVWAVMLKLFVRRKVKVLFHDHFGKAESLKNTDRKWLKSISLGIDGIMVVNDKLLAWNQTNMKVEKEKIIQINNFPYLKMKSFSLPNSDSIHILHLANFRPQKDHFNLLHALGLLQKRVPTGWKISLVGLASDQTYLNLIKEKIKELGLENKIHFIGASNQVERFLEEAQVGVLSSESEGLSVSLLEYGIAGLHTVATEVGQAKSVISHSNLGELVPPKNSEVLADALEKALEKAKLGRNNELRDFVENKFGATSFSEKYFGLIESIQ